MAPRNYLPQILVKLLFSVTLLGTSLFGAPGQVVAAETDDALVATAWFTFYSS